MWATAISDLTPGERYARLVAILRMESEHEHGVVLGCCFGQTEQWLY